MNTWKKYFADDDIFFVTPDVKRGLGFAGILPKYHIICSEPDPLIAVLRKQGAKIFCLEEKGVDISKIRNSGKLLEAPQVLAYIKDNAKKTPRVMYFKPSLKLDTLIRSLGFKPIGNNADTNELFEDKVNFFQITQKDLAEYAVPALVGKLKELRFIDLYKKLGLPFVLQFGHGWAGKTTFFIKREQEYNWLVQKFPYTKVKVSKFIKGFTVLNNCCLYNGKVLISSPAIQIDTILELGTKPGVTCGRQWPVKFIDDKQVETIQKISQVVGSLMHKRGFKGFFGIDFFIEEKTGKIYLSEVNPRLTASAPFFTLLEIGLDKTPLLAYHLAEFLDKSIPIELDLRKNIVGSQMIVRRSLHSSIFENKRFGVFKLDDTKPLFIRNDYYPDNLAENEFIFMAKNKIDESDGDEFARIESKREMLEEPKKLKRWIRKLLIKD